MTNPPTPTHSTNGQPTDAQEFDTCRKLLKKEPSALHRERENGKNVGMNGHILIEQIHEAVEVSFSVAIAAMTRQEEKQPI